MGIGGEIDECPAGLGRRALRCDDIRRGAAPLRRQAVGLWSGVLLLLLLTDRDLLPGLLCDVANELAFRGQLAVLDEFGHQPGGGVPVYVQGVPDTPGADTPFPAGDLDDPLLQWRERICGLRRG